MIRLKEKNFDLTRQEFDELKEALTLGDDELFKKIFLAQVEESIRFLVRRFAAEYDEAYDCVLETLVTFHQRIGAGKVEYGNLRFLFTQMASQYYQTSKGKESKLRVVEEEFAGLPVDTSSDYDEEQLLRLQHAWTQLGAKCQQLLRMNYHMDMNLKEIADVIGSTHASIRKQKQRCQEALKDIYFKK